MKGIKVYYNENGGMTIEITENLDSDKVIELTEALNKEIFGKTFAELDELNSNLEFQNDELVEKLTYEQQKESNEMYEDPDYY